MAAATTVPAPRYGAMGARLVNPGGVMTADSAIHAHRARPKGVCGVPTLAARSAWWESLPACGGARGCYRELTKRGGQRFVDSRQLIVDFRRLLPRFTAQSFDAAEDALQAIDFVLELGWLARVSGAGSGSRIGEMRASRLASVLASSSRSACARLTWFSTFPTSRGAAPVATPSPDILSSCFPAVLSERVLCCC